jgi:outer membrane protein assembly factor BamA
LTRFEAAEPRQHQPNGFASVRVTARRLAAGLAFAAAIAASGNALAQMPSAAELEQRGATIRDIAITVDNVFDTSNPDEDKKLYHWANRVHVRTRPNVIEDVLLFEAGERFDARVVDESARTLRARDFLADATITPARYDAATNSVDLDVHVRDSWTLAPDLKFSRSGGENEVGAGLSDSNLFGTGKELTVSYTEDVDRDRSFLAYDDANVYGTRVRLGATLANASDGHRRAFAAERPFFALDSRWSVGGSVSNDRHVQSVYDLGETLEKFRHDQRSLTLSGGWSHGLVDRRSRRWLFGVTSERHRFLPAEGEPAPTVLPEGRELVYPWIGWQLVEDDFRAMSELNDMGRTEDVALGLNMLFTLGRARERFGSDRDAWLFGASVHHGWEPGGDGRLLLFDSGVSTRREEAGYRNTIAFADARYYHRNLENHLFSAQLRGVTTHRLDAEEQVLIGGDNGLRGYPLRYQAGAHSLLLTLEQRFYTDWYPWRLLRVGWAVFMDAGRVRGEDVRGTTQHGALYDVGLGLRLSSPRSSGRSIVHIDLAFPLNGPADTDSLQLVIETKATF